jgi:predicted Zn-dependent protease
MFEPYSPCPCGSGKKFKWCCQPIHAALGKVFALDDEGQHEAALRLMDEVAAQHPTNPEVWGRKALLEFQNERPADAEKTLEKAFELNANYAFGFFLKARFRLYEGEIGGALLLLRKATELYDPEAKDMLAQLYIDIFDCEMKLNHPVAAHAAAELALKFNPTNENLRNGIPTVFGKDNPNLPASAIRKYEFMILPADAPAERRTAWAGALQAAATGKLADATRAFDQLAQAEPNQPAAWFNLALCQAWTGNNPAAVAAIQHYVELEADETRAAQAWALAEVLRLGHGMVDQADVVEHSITASLRDPNAFVTTLSELEREGLLAGVRVDQEQGMLTAMVLESPGPALTPELQARQGMKLAAYLVMVGNILRIWNVNQEALERTFARVREKAGNTIAETLPSRGPAKFIEMLSEGITFSKNAGSKEEAEQRLREGFTQFLEEKWIHRPLKSLGGVAPVDAAGHAGLRKKVRGLVQFMRECAALTKFPYDFARLEHKLGLDGTAPGNAAGTPAYSAMNAAELAGLPAATLAPADLEQAYQAALALDARELAGKFAAELVGRAPYPERPDRFTLFQLLIGQSLSHGDTGAALDRVNEGEKDDCENNGGKRRNDYELRRAQVHAKRGEIDQAEDVFDRLIARIPSELNVRVNAAETMLSARQQSKALKYVQQGLAEAVKQKNRDLEGHFRELQAAAAK